MAALCHIKQGMKLSVLHHVIDSGCKTVSGHDLSNILFHRNKDVALCHFSDGTLRSAFSLQGYVCRLRLWTT